MDKYDFTVVFDSGFRKVYKNQPLDAILSVISDFSIQAVIKGFELKKV